MPALAFFILKNLIGGEEVKTDKEKKADIEKVKFEVAQEMGLFPPKREKEKGENLKKS